MADVPYGVVTLTSHGPDGPVPRAGALHVICVSETTVTLVALVPPKVTTVAPVKLVPVMVTVFPPLWPPLMGFTTATAGGGT